MLCLSATALAGHPHCCLPLLANLFDDVLIRLPVSLRTQILWLLLHLLVKDPNIIGFLFDFVSKATSDVPLDARIAIVGAQVLHIAQKD